MRITGPPLGFNRVSATWDVPEVTRTGGIDTFSYTWTGIGGGTSGEPVLIQAGTGQDVSGGAPSYFAWWEAYPAPLINVGAAFSVSPADTITVIIDGSGLVVWNISIRNHDANWTFNTTIPFVVAGLSAEWIEEEPGVHAGGVSQTALANFDKVDFSDLTANGANPHLNHGIQLEMVDSTNILARPSDSDGDSFSVCYGSDSCH